MSWAHKGSNLALEDMLIAVPDDAHYFPFDHHLASTKLLYPEGYDNHTVTDYGLYTGTNLCATLRRGEGKFGGAVAVEEGTENLIVNPLFKNGLIGWKKENVVSSNTIEVENISTPYGDKALVVTAQEGTPNPYQQINLPAGTIVTVTVMVRRVSGVGNPYLGWGSGYNMEPPLDIKENGKWYTFSRTGEVGGNHNLILRTPTNASARFEYAFVQLEEKPFATSFVDGTRPDGILAYPLTLPDDHTIACYRKSHTDEGYKHVVKRSDGKVFVDGVEDSEYDVGWIAGRNLFRKDFFADAEVSGATGYAFNSGDFLNGFKITGGNNNRTGFVKFGGVIKGNGKYTVSFRMRGTQNVLVGLKVNICGNVSKTLVSNSSNTYGDVLEFTADVTNYEEGINDFIQFEGLVWVYYRIDDLKLERGNTATDWTPAPEDLGYDGDTLMLSNQTGLIDDLMISRGSLSPEEIRSIYHSQRPLYDPNFLAYIVAP